MYYHAYVLSDASRERLCEIFPLKYPKVIARHITHRFGVSIDTPIPEPISVKVLGSADDNRGIQALIVEIDGERLSPEGYPYHITWSYDPSKIAPAEFDIAELGNQKPSPYRAAHSNKLVALGQHTTLLEHPIEISVHGKILEAKKTLASPIRTT